MRRVREAAGVANIADFIEGLPEGCKGRRDGLLQGRRDGIAAGSYQAKRETTKLMAERKYPLSEILRPHGRGR